MFRQDNHRPQFVIEGVVGEKALCVTLPESRRDLGNFASE